MARRVAGSRRSDRAALPPETEPGPALPAEPAPTLPPEPALIVVGRIGRPQGIKGEVTVEVRTDDPDDRFAPGRVLQTDRLGAQPLTVEGSRWQGKYLVVAFQGVHDRNQAELLRDTMLRLDTADLPPLAQEDEYYDTQLIGLEAQLEDGTLLGTIGDVLHLPGGDVLAVERPTRLRGKDAELLVPFVKAIVPVVDLEAGHVVVDPPPGLLELSETPPEPLEP